MATDFPPSGNDIGSGLKRKSSPVDEQNRGRSKRVLISNSPGEITVPISEQIAFPLRVLCNVPTESKFFEETIRKVLSLYKPELNFETALVDDLLRQMSKQGADEARQAAASLVLRRALRDHLSDVFNGRIGRRIKSMAALKELFLQVVDTASADPNNFIYPSFRQKLLDLFALCETPLEENSNGVAEVELGELKGVPNGVPTHASPAQNLKESKDSPVSTSGPAPVIAAARSPIHQIGKAHKPTSGTEEKTVISSLFEPAATERTTSERAATEREAKEREAKEREAKEREAKEREAKERVANVQRATQRAATERTASERAASERAVAKREVNERAANVQRAIQRTATERASTERAATERAATEQAATELAAADQRAADAQACNERAATEQAVADTRAADARASNERAVACARTDTDQASQASKSNNERSEEKSIPTRPATMAGGIGPRPLPLDQTNQRKVPKKDITCWYWYRGRLPCRYSAESCHHAHAVKDYLQGRHGAPPTSLFVGNVLSPSTIAEGSVSLSKRISSPTSPTASLLAKRETQELKPLSRNSVPTQEHKDLRPPSCIKKEGDAPADTRHPLNENRTSVPSRSPGVKEPSRTPIIDAFWGGDVPIEKDDQQKMYTSLVSNIYLRAQDKTLFTLCKEKGVVKNYNPSKPYGILAKVAEIFAHQPGTGFSSAVVRTMLESMLRPFVVANRHIFEDVAPSIFDDDKMCEPDQPFQDKANAEDDNDMPSRYAESSPPKGVTCVYWYKGFCYKTAEECLYKHYLTNYVSRRNGAGPVPIANAQPRGS